MNKKGFTLVEVIICISLIVLIGTTSIITLNKLNDRKSLIEEINLKIKDAVNVFLNVEKDSKGNTYLNGIQKGGKGLYFTINELHAKGYISEDLVKTLEKEANKDRTQLKLLASDSLYIDDSRECGANYIKIDFSWNTLNSDEPIYLCPILDEVPINDDTLFNKMISLGYSSNCGKETQNALCYLHSYDNNSISDANEDGTSSDVYYFKGNADNNYLKINGIDKLFRIVRTTENNNIKIVDNETIPLEIYSYGTEGGTYSSNILKYSSSSDYFEEYITTQDETGEFTLDKYKIGSSSFYTCNGSYKYSKWDDNKTTNCRDVHGYNHRLYSPIYQYIYLPLKNSYFSIQDKIDKYIDKNYKWCLGNSTSNNITNISFKCDKEKKLISDFGLLNLFEYENISYFTDKDTSVKAEDKYDKAYAFGTAVFTHCDPSKELAFAGNQSTFKTLQSIIPSYGYNCGRSRDIDVMRIAHVIKGDSKVIQGDGTRTNPFIIE